MSFIQSWMLSKPQPPTDALKASDEILPTGALTAPINGQPKVDDDLPKETPFITPEIARRYPNSKIPQITPKKGILKHTNRAKSTEPFPVFSANKDPAVGSIRATVSYTLADSFFKLPNSSGTRPTVGFSEKNAVAIIGDTSDEYESDGRKSFSLPIPSERLPRIPETTIVEPPQKMVSEPEAHGVVNGVFLSTEESDSASVKSQDESKITEGRSTDDLFSTTEDDLVSISSSTCSSHIAGKWWNGKDQRFVVHCDKKGCKHRHGSPKINDGYLTPTQRSNREIASLKNEIKKLNKEHEQKEQQLVELRERIKSIDDGNELSQDNKLMRLLEEKGRKHEEEKEKLKESEQAMAAHLNQQIFELQNQLSAKQLKVERLEAELFKSHQDACTMTDAVEIMDEFPPCSDGQTTLSSGSVVHTPNDPNPNAMGTQFLNVGQKSVSVQQSPSFPSVPAQVAIATDPMTEAYRQEALFFRTKASELELIVREHILRGELTVNDAVQTLGPAEAELTAEDLQEAEDDDEGLAQLKRKLTHSMSLMSVAGGGGFGGNVGTLRRQQSMVTGECQSTVCAEKIRQLTEENESILEKMDDQFVRLSELEEEMSKANETLEAEQKASAALKIDHEELSNLANERLAESISAQRAYQKVQEEAEKLEKAVSYLEDRCQAYQNTILDHGLVVRGEETSEWRTGFNDPRFKTLFSKQAQTELTGQELTANESDFTLLHVQLREVQKEYRERQLDLDAQFAEIVQNLTLKTKLVEQLSKQLEISARDSQLIEEHRQKERDYYKERIEQLSNELERLPGLQIEIERAQQDKSLLEIELRTIKEQYEDGLDEALNEALKKYREQEEYWADKVQNLDRARVDVKNNLDKLHLNYEELKMRAQVEKTELEQRLASSIEHVAVLNQQLNPPRRDVSVEAKPKTVNKYVACRPNHRHKCVEVDRKELEPSQSDLNVAELVKYKEALLRARRRLSDLNPPKAPARPPPPTIRIMEERDDEEESEEKEEEPKEVKQREEFVFKGLKKSKVSRSQLSFDQVYFDREAGVKLPILRRGDGSDEDEDQHDTISFMSLPATMDYQRGVSVDDTDSHGASTQTPIEEEEVFEGKEKSDSEERPLIAEGIKMEVLEDGSMTRREHSIEDIRNLDEHTQLLEDEIHRLRRKVVRADELEQKLNRIQTLLPPILHIGAPVKERKIRKPIDVLLDDVVKVLRDSKQKEPLIQRSASASNLEDVEKFPFLIKPCVQLNAKLKKKSPPRFKPLPIPNKWDNERAELLRQNAHYAAQLLALKAKLGTIRQESGVEEKTGLDKVEEELRELAEQMTTLPEVHAQKLARTRKDRDELFMENLDLQMKLQDALNELEIYHREPREEARKRLESKHLPRSRSAESLTHAGGPEELRRWKESAGVSFRELNHLRRLCDAMTDEKQEMRTQMAIMRGETELTKCQMAMASEWAARKLATMRRRPSQTGNKLQVPAVTLTKRRASAGNASLNLLDVDATSMPDLIKASLPPSLQQQSHKRSIPGDLDRQTMDEFWSDSPLHKELRHALKRQMSTLRDKNKELQLQVEGLEEKIKVDEKENIKIEEHDAIVDGLSERVEILRQETEMYENKIRDIESERQEMYLVMFRKGQQAAHHDFEEDKRIDEMTEDRIVLKFLHDAFYYYLLSKGDSREHLQAIMTMLNFTSKQKDEIYKKRGKSQ